MKIICSASIVLMLLFGTLLMIDPSSEAEAAVITVSSDGTGMYSSVQEAVDNAVNGDVIRISNGTYEESVFVDASNISILGSDPHLTRIIASENSTGIVVLGDNVTISGLNVSGGKKGLEANLVDYLSVLNSTLQGSDNSMVLARTDGLTMENCTFFNETVIMESSHAYMNSNRFFHGGLTLYGSARSSWSSHSIDDSNTVNGKELVYISGSNGDTVGQNAGQIIIADCQSSFIGSQSMSDVSVPVQIAFSNMVTLTASTFRNCRVGLYLFRTISSTIAGSSFVNCSGPGVSLQRSDWNSITGSNMSRNLIGLNIVDSSNNTITDVTTSNNQDTGIGIFTDRADNRSMDNVIRRCVSRSGRFGIVINGSAHNRITGSNISRNTDCGILIDTFSPYRHAEDNYIADTTIMENGVDGIRIRNDSKSFIDDCSISKNGQSAIISINSQYAYISNSTVTHHGVQGISISFGSFMLSGNQIFNCSDAALSTVFCHDSTITKNGIFGPGSDTVIMGGGINILENRFNDTSLKVYDSTGIVANNIFTETEVISQADLHWNTTKKAGINIIGGPYLGGNYWSDYQGVDIDGDGLGDTHIPHGPGDHLPLQYDLIKPGIEDLTEGTPTTGDLFHVKARLIDERVGLYPFIEYWFGNSTEHINESMVLCDPWGYDISVPEDSVDPLHYIISVRDEGGNWNSTPVSTRKVEDNDPPVLSMDLRGEPCSYVGEIIEFSSSGSDNIGIEEVRLRYIDVNGTDHNESVGINVHTYFSVPAQHSMGTVTMWLWGMDAAGNVNESEHVTVTILATDPPVVEILHPVNGSYIGGTVGVDLSVTDRFENITSVYMEILRNDTMIYTIDLQPVNGEKTIDLNTSVFDDGMHKISVHAEDGSGLRGTASVIVHLDNTAPVADAGPDMKVMNGSTIVLNGSGSHDENGLTNGSFKWKFTDGGEAVELEGMVPLYTFSGQGEYRIKLIVTDRAGNHDSDIIIVSVPPNPMVLAASVEDGDSDQDIDMDILIFFSESMNRTSVFSSLVMEPIESYNLVWSDNDTVLTVKFPDGLSYDTLYTITLNSPRSVDGAFLSPEQFSLGFRTKVLMDLIILKPEDGNRISPGSVFTISGKLQSSEPGAEVTATIGGRTFSSTVMGVDGSFEITAMAPEEPGYHDVVVESGESQASISIFVQDEPADEDGSKVLPLIGIILIVMVLVVASYVWISKGSKGGVDQELEDIEE